MSLPWDTLFCETSLQNWPMTVGKAHPVRPWFGSHLLCIFIQLTSSFPLLAEIIPRPRPPIRHHANLMFGRNSYRAFHRLNPMHTGKTGRFGLQKNRPSSVPAILRHVRHVQMYTAAIQMYSSGTLASVGITLIKMLPNHSVHKSKNFLY